ncbi:MAG: GAF domain-containing protein [Bacteroidales bacterium]|nr:GAF domain-containing protein [Bacteroidales bacterium]
MINLSKYRRFILVTFMVIIVAAFLTLAAIWNSMLTVKDIRNEGWIIVFLIILIAACVILFYFSLKLSDTDAFQEAVDRLVATEKEKLIKKMEEKKKQEQETTVDESDLKESIGQIYSGLQSVKSIETFANKVLMNISKQIEIVRGVFFYRSDGGKLFTCKGEYALTGNKPASFKPGENLTGQAAINKTITSIHEIPENYFKVESGLGGTLPKHLIILPLVYKDETLAVIELATFKKINTVQFKILNILISELGERLNKFVSTK